MARRIEITVPHEWSIPVKQCLEDRERCGILHNPEKPSMVSEIVGIENTIFLITVPAVAVTPTLEVLRRNGIGISVGRMILTSLEYMRPELGVPLCTLYDVEDPQDPSVLESSEENASQSPKGSEGFSSGPKRNNDLRLPSILTERASSVAATPYVSRNGSKKLVDQMAYFQKARKTTEELHKDISDATNMTINTWLNLIGASIIAGAGLASNAVIFIVASILISPIMGPILGMIFGYRVADWDLFKRGVINEAQMALTAIFCGAMFGLIMGYSGKTYQWIDSAIVLAGESYDVATSFVVAIAAGVVLAISVTSEGGNALVGTAISAGLHPPLVGSGMLIAYGMTYADKSEKNSLYGKGGYSLLFYVVHVVIIFLVANFIFWIKEIQPSFRQGGESLFMDAPSLLRLKRQQKDGADNPSHLEITKITLFMRNIYRDMVAWFSAQIDWIEKVCCCKRNGAPSGERAGYEQSDHDSPRATEENQWVDVPDDVNIEAGVGKGVDMEDLRLGAASVSAAQARSLVPGAMSASATPTASSLAAEAVPAPTLASTSTSATAAPQSASSGEPDVSPIHVGTTTL